jgi:hypothetical protein
MNMLEVSRGILGSVELDSTPKNPNILNDPKPRFATETLRKSSFSQSASSKKNSDEESKGPHSNKSVSFGERLSEILKQDPVDRLKQMMLDDHFINILVF